MGRFYTSKTIENSLKLRSALLIYASDDEKQGVIMRASVSEKAGELTLHSPENITGDLSEQILKSAGKSSLAYQPEHILAQNYSGCVWFIPAQERTLNFNAPKSSIMEISRQRFMQPPLVFKVLQNKLWVYALKENKRPVPDTQLYMAPYWNTSSSVCLGSTIIPERLDTAQWEENFYTSNFTHPSSGPRWNPAMTHHELWLAVREAGAFNPDWLLEEQLSLQEILS